MTLSETVKVSKGRVWVRATGTAAEILQSLATSGVRPENVVNIAADGTSVIYCRN